MKEKPQDFIPETRIPDGTPQYDYSTYESVDGTTSISDYVPNARGSLTMDEASRLIFGDVNFDEPILESSHLASSDVRYNLDDALASALDPDRSPHFSQREIDEGDAEEERRSVEIRDLLGRIRPGFEARSSPHGIALEDYIPR